MEEDFQTLQTNSFIDDVEGLLNNPHFGDSTYENRQCMFNSQASVDNCRQSNETKFKLKEPSDVEEILKTDKTLIPATSHNVSVINSACQEVLKQMEHQLLTMLKKNRREQEIVQHYIATNGKSSDSENLKKPPVKIAGMPYFKDKYGFVPPPNEDVLRKKRNGKLLPVDFINSFPVWTPLDAKKLIKAVEREEGYKNSQIDWMKISATDMEGKYSPVECKSKWMMNLKPDVNRSKWSVKENKLLRDIAAKYDCQNWDKIAEELGTGRTGLQCCIQYQTHKCPSEGKWSAEEDEKLKMLVEKYRVKDFIPWMKIVWHFQHRSFKQCQERYAYHLGNIKKGAFTMEEDFVIVYLASKLKNFGQVAKFLPNRVATQVRARYEYLVQLSMPEFTKEEDELLTKLMIQYPKNWAKISEHFENRSKVQCRRRWGFLQKGIKVGTDVGSGEEDAEDAEDGNVLLPFRSESEGKRRCDTDAAMLKKNLHLISKPERVGKAYTETYNKLLEHHEHCHKFLFGPRPRICTTLEDSKKLVTKLKITMRNLSVCESPIDENYDVSGLSTNCEFDTEDVKVLEGVKSTEGVRELVLSNKIIPPNFITLVGLRTIFLIWSRIKNLTKETPQPAGDSNNRVLCSDAKKLFKTRMKALFTYPLLLSNIKLEKPKTVYKAKVRKTAKPMSKLQRKRHAKYMSEAYRKKIEKSLCEKLGVEDGENVGEVVEPRRKRKYTRRTTEGSESGKPTRKSPRTRQSGAPPCKKRAEDETLTNVCSNKLFTV